MKELNYSSSGQILSLGKSSIELLSGIPVTGIVCEYAEDFIIDNYIAALKNRGHGLPALVYDNNMLQKEQSRIQKRILANEISISCGIPLYQDDDSIK